MQNLTKVLSQNPVLYIIVIILSIIILYTTGRIVGSALAESLFYLKN